MIPLTTPHTIPATSEKTFDSLWIQELIVRSPGPGQEGPVTVRLVPVNSTTLETDESAAFVVEADIFKASKAHPKVAAAMGAVFGAVPELIPDDKPH